MPRFEKRGRRGSGRTRNSSCRVEMIYFALVTQYVNLLYNITSHIPNCTHQCRCEPPPLPVPLGEWIRVCSAEIRTLGNPFHPYAVLELHTHAICLRELCHAGPSYTVRLLAAT
eukprot:366532-Chlamydomonas_euryale.AAC.4